MIAARQIRTDAARLWKLAIVDGEPDEDRIRAIATLIVHSGRRAGRAVLRDFLRRLKRDRARRAARVESAVALDFATRSAVEAGLRRRYGHPMTTAFVVDPRLIAGLRVRAADDMLDGTVKARLDALEAA